MAEEGVERDRRTGRLERDGLVGLSFVVVFVFVMVVVGVVLLRLLRGIGLIGLVFGSKGGGCLCSGLRRTFALGVGRSSLGVGLGSRLLRGPLLLGGG